MIDRIKAREAVYKSIVRVVSDGFELERALDEVCLKSQELEPLRPWMMDIASTVLRSMGWYEFVLEKLAHKKKPSGFLKYCLCMAMAQIFEQTEVSPIVVVDETVNWVKKREGLAPSKFVNALLRRIVEHKEDLKIDKIDRSLEGPKLVQASSLPDWIFLPLFAAYGKEVAINYALASQKRPKIFFASNNKKENLLKDFEPGSGKTLTDILGNQYIVQDLSSQVLVSQISEIILKQIQEPKALDLCSAPGGKAIGLYWQGFDVVATDVSQKRLDLVIQNNKRLGLDSKKFKILPKSEIQKSSNFDLVWVDAPCSGSGTLRKHPEIKWLKSKKDLDSLRAIQRDLLNESLNYVAPGGYIAYSVCSVLPEEGPKQIEWFLENAAQDCKLSVQKTWFLGPHQEGFEGDGFWSALIKKEK